MANGSAMKKLTTLWMIFLWFLLLPIIAFIPHSNCWYYSVKRWILEGFKGKVIPVESRRWRGVPRRGWSVMGIYIEKNA